MEPGSCLPIDVNRPFLTSEISTSLYDAKTIFNADETYSISNFGSYVKTLLPSLDRVYVDLPGPASKPSARSAKKTNLFLKYLSGYFGSGGAGSETLEGISASLQEPLTPVLGKMRAVKSVAEQRVMRQAADISSKAHAKVSTSPVSLP